MRSRSRCPGSGAAVASVASLVGAGTYLSALAALIVPVVPLVPASIALTSPLFTPELANAGFTHANGVLTYVGPGARKFHVVGNASVTVGSEEETLVFLGISVNEVAPFPAGFGAENTGGSDAVANITAQRYVLLNPGDRVGLVLAAGVSQAVGVVLASLVVHE